MDLHLKNNSPFLHDIEEVLPVILASISGSYCKDEHRYRYAYPSAGAIYPIQLLLAVQSPLFQGKLEVGNYVFDSEHRQLFYANDALRACLSPYLQGGADQWPISFILVLELDRLRHCYGERSLRLGYLELGHYIETINAALREHHCFFSIKSLSPTENNGDIHLAFLQFNKSNVKAVRDSWSEQVQQYFAKRQVLVRQRDIYQGDGSKGFNIGDISIVDRLSGVEDILGSAEEVVIFVAPPEPQYWIYSGAAAQVYTTMLTREGKGSCSLGVEIPGYEGYVVAVGREDTSPKPYNQAIPRFASLQDTLRHQLPEYMIPAQFCVLESIPMSQNGKLDFGKLPSLESQQPEIIPPETECEKRICDIWCHVLALAEIGIDTPVTSLCADSLTAVQLVNEMILHGFKDFTLSELYLKKTIRRIANSALSGARFKKTIGDKIDIDSADVIFVHPAYGGCECYAEIINAVQRNYTVALINNFNIDNEDKIETLAKLAEQYLFLYFSDISVPRHIVLVGWSMGGQIAIEIARLLEKAGWTKVKLVLLDTVIPTIQNKEATVEEWDEFIAYMEEYLLAEGHRDEYVRNIVNNMPLDYRLSKQTPVGTLITTEGTLFRATRLQLEPARMKYKKLWAKHEKEYSFLSQSDDNNLGSVVPYLNVINVPSSHLSIIGDNVEEIVTAIHHYLAMAKK